MCSLSLCHVNTISDSLKRDQIIARVPSLRYAKFLFWEEEAGNKPWHQKDMEE